MRTRLVRRLGALALRARDERHGAQREMTAAFALRRARYAFLGMSCQSDLLDGGTAILTVGAELLELLQLAPAIVGSGVVLVRVDIQVAPADLAEPPAIGAAERGERRREDELLA